MKRVAIQGVKGAYHEIAARNYFKDEDLEIVPCLTFRDIFKEAEKDPSLIGIMAIENTIAGSLLQNHDLLRQSNLQIAGEYKLRISHSLAALPGQTIDQIHEVMSHPIALMQCEDFLETLPDVKIVEHEDTALAAKEIRDKSLMGYAAVCSSLAAEIYGLQILKSGIETNKRNFTRFLILAREEMLAEVQKDNHVNKSSLVFILSHHEGSLSQVLSVLSFYGLNLTRIQSLPIIGREWEYQFYIDLTFTNFERYKQSIDAILPLVRDLKILGEYREDKQTIED
ncbi:MAG: prephenate dehydratase [Dysgonamonadaceae bacterium]|jgi:prephenate dehydratase|nr:prephenate dehydratase [Dysgonamonadaceae bacterium]MDD3309075.1 prephenate dehydratase [Dysgonamonadaceae bacterium]MDD3899879.1 prephenate dehydratase [Dysgonamonadaceae bacterium]MDD4398577.1 prephenate dehydratase [Dysgonamonadaceae bacterium]MEA5080925.1 prephenate dehydratase [Dysgonamonadaceae bacterium]